MPHFLDFIKAFKVDTDVGDFIIGGVFMQEGQLIVFKNKKLCGAQLQWPIQVCCLKTWQHYLGTHKTNFFTNNVSLKYFLSETIKRTRYFSVVECGIDSQTKTRIT